jgi:hypothetical protein
MAEEARGLRDQHHEALETLRQEREQLREAAETARLAGEGARIAAEAARQATMDAVHATAETLQATLEHMQVVEEMRRTLRRTVIHARCPAISYAGALDLISKQQRGRCERSQHS